MKAFKEWKPIIDALGSGEQAIVIRKGGIHEDGGSFSPDYKSFFLFPTAYHVEKEGLKHPDYVKTFNPGSHTPIAYYAENIETITLDNVKQLDAIEQFHIWSKDLVMERFERWKSEPLYLFILRVFKIDKEVSVENTPMTAGCKSWIDLDLEEPQRKKPVIDDHKFHQLYKTVSSGMQM